MLANLDGHVLGVRIGTYDTIFSLAGVLMLIGAIYAVVNLKRENSSHGT